MRSIAALVFALGLACSSPAAKDSEPAPVLARTKKTVNKPVVKKPPVVKPTPAKPASGPPVLAAHNAVRAKHCAPPLAWSDKLAAVAQKWANQLRDRNCAFDHSESGFGENLAMGSQSIMSAEGVVNMWYGEIESYDFKRPGFSMQTGHFTQVVWKGSKQLGCATATCAGKGMTIWVCNYDPPGNWDKQFAANVVPTSCR